MAVLEVYLGLRDCVLCLITIAGHKPPLAQFTEQLKIRLVLSRNTTPITEIWGNSGYCVSGRRAVGKGRFPCGMIWKGG